MALSCVVFEVRFVGYNVGLQILTINLTINR